MARHVISNKWKVVLVLLALWVFKVCIWQRYSTDPNRRIFNVREAIGHVLTRHFDGGWYLEEDICNGKKDDFVLAHLRKPANTPIYVYSDKVDEYVSSDVIYLGGYEMYNTERLLEYMKKFPHAVFLDIGAYVGTFSITMAAHGYSVIAVECLRSSVARMCASIRAAKVKDRIVIIHNALADARRMVHLTSEPKNVGMTYIDTDKASNETIDAILLNDLLEIFPLSQVIMKLDAHVQEDIILDGAHTFFKEVRVEALLIEFVHHKEDRYDNDGKFIIDFLDDHDLEPDLPEHIKYDYKNWQTSEILFKRKIGT